MAASLLGLPPLGTPVVVLVEYVVARVHPVADDRPVGLV
jgi:hypothetical protein